MEQVLKNLANQMLIEYCKAKSIDCSGTYCTKDGRGFSFTLRKQKPEDIRWPDIARITFHKNQTPTYGWK